MNQQPAPCATCDRPENDHARTCPLSPHYVSDPIPSDIPGTTRLIDAELYLCPADAPGPCDTALGLTTITGHQCAYDEHHHAPHECICGHQWTGHDDD